MQISNFGFRLDYLMFVSDLSWNDLDFMLLIAPVAAGEGRSMTLGQGQLLGGQANQDTHLLGKTLYKLLGFILRKVAVHI